MGGVGVKVKICYLKFLWKLVSRKGVSILTIWGGEGQFGRPFFKLVLFYMFYGSSMCIFILHLYQIVANL